MNKELREAVARGIYAREYDADHYSLDREDSATQQLVYSQADAAISIIRPAVLEEAAKVADDMGEAWRESGDVRAGVGCNTCADAIRALAKEGE